MRNYNGLYQHIKTGAYYVVLFCTICADNGSEGQRTIIYRKLDDDDCVYDRKVDEFLEKFIHCDIKPTIQDEQIN